MFGLASGDFRPLSAPPLHDTLAGDYRVVPYNSKVRHSTKDYITYARMIDPSHTLSTTMDSLKTSTSTNDTVRPSYWALEIADIGVSTMYTTYP